MASVLVNAGRVVSQGTNKTGAGVLKDKRYDKSRNGYQVGIHSELESVLRAPEGSTRGATIYIAGYTQNGNKIHSQPCYRCYSLLKEYGIRRAIYHDRNGNECVMEIR